jgi:hypothetical protein
MILSNFCSIKKKKRRKTNQLFRTVIPFRLKIYAHIAVDCKKSILTKKQLIEISGLFSKIV